MSQPEKSVVVAGPLQNVSLAYKNPAYIARRIFNLLPNCPAKARIGLYLKGAWFRDEAGVRGPGSEARRGGYPTSYYSIQPVEYAFAKEVTDEDRRWASQQGAFPVKPDQDAIEFATDKIDLKIERVVSAMIFAGTWSGVNGADAAGAWAAGGNNTFIADVEAKKQYILSQTGLKPNVLMLTGNTLSALKQESSVLDKIKYTQMGVLTPALIAAMLDLDEVLVGDSIYSSAKETKAGTDFTGVNIWEKNAGKGAAFLFYRPGSPGLKTPAAGYIAQENLVANSPRRITTWREESRKQDVYEVAESLDVVQTGPDLGYLWYDTILT